MFSIDYNILIQLVLPFSLRKARIIAILKSFINPVELIYNEFITYRLASLKRLNYSGQVIYLEKLLNDYFNTSGIYIEDTADIEYTYLSTKNEGDVLYLSTKAENNAPVYLATQSELESNYQFIVKIPSVLYANLGTSGLSRMRSLIDLYRISGKKFEIHSI